MDSIGTGMTWRDHNGLYPVEQGTVMTWWDRNRVCPVMQGTGRSAKTRQRAQMACEHCRRLKRRCHSLIERCCSNCRKYNKMCTFTSASTGASFVPALHQNEYQPPYQAPRDASQFYLTQGLNAPLLPPPVPGSFSQTSSAQMESVLNSKLSGNGAQPTWNPGFLMPRSTHKQLFGVVGGIDRNLTFSTPSIPSSTLKQSFGTTASAGVDRDMLNRFSARIS